MPSYINVLLKYDHENYPSTYLTNILGYIFIWGVNNGLHLLTISIFLFKKRRIILMLQESCGYLMTFDMIESQNHTTRSGENIFTQCWQIS